jgi:hypothetical protein
MSAFSAASGVPFALHHNLGDDTAYSMMHVPSGGGWSAHSTGTAGERGLRWPSPKTAENTGFPHVTAQMVTPHVAARMLNPPAVEGGAPSLPSASELRSRPELMHDAPLSSQHSRGRTHLAPQSAAEIEVGGVQRPVTSEHGASSVINDAAMNNEQRLLSIVEKLIGRILPEEEESQSGIGGGRQRFWRDAERGPRSGPEPRRGSEGVRSAGPGRNPRLPPSTTSRTGAQEAAALQTDSTPGWVVPVLVAFGVLNVILLGALFAMVLVMRSRKEEAPRKKRRAPRAASAPSTSWAQQVAQEVV